MKNLLKTLSISGDQLDLGNIGGDDNLLNPKFIFGCNNILDTKKIRMLKNYIKMKGNILSLMVMTLN